MKKHLIAAAVAGVLAAPAMAQVTMYGIVEAGIGSTSTSGSTSTTGVVDSTVNTSRLGFKGSEDLGGGMSAIFGLEARLDPQTGDVDEAKKNSFFERGAYVGLSGGFGTVKIGKLDHQGGENNDATVFGNVGLISGSVEIGSDRNNTIDYTTPAMGGFKLNIAHSLKDNGNSDADNTHDGITTYQISGAVGSVNIKVGGGEEKEVNGTKTKVMGVSAGTSIAGAKVGVSYQTAEVASVDRTFTGVNAAVPLGGALTGYGVFGKYDVDGSTSTDSTATTIALGYALSKRTTVYGLHRNTDLGTGGADKKETQLLISHSF
jgi:predicted porin